MTEPNKVTNSTNNSSYSPTDPLDGSNENGSPAKTDPLIAIIIVVVILVIVIIAAIVLAIFRNNRKETSRKQRLGSVHYDATEPDDNNVTFAPNEVDDDVDLYTSVNKDNNKQVKRFAKGENVEST